MARGAHTTASGRVRTCGKKRLVHSAHQEWMRSALGSHRRARPRGLPPCRRSLRLMAELPRMDRHRLPGLMWPVQLMSPHRAGLILQRTASARPRSCRACDTHADWFILLMTASRHAWGEPRTHVELAPHDTRASNQGWSTRVSHRLRGPDSVSASPAAKGDDGSALFLPAAGVEAEASAPETCNACRCRQDTAIKHEQIVSKGVTQKKSRPENNTWGKAGV